MQRQEKESRKGQVNQMKEEDELAVKEPPVIIKMNGDLLFTKLSLLGQKNYFSCSNLLEKVSSTILPFTRV